MVNMHCNNLFTVCVLRTRPISCAVQYSKSPLTGAFLLMINKSSHLSGTRMYVREQSKVGNLYNKGSADK